MTEPRTPRTAAGRALLTSWLEAPTPPHLRMMGQLQFTAAILAIEDEAATPSLEALREALDDIRSLTTDMPPAWNDPESFYRSQLASAISMAQRALSHAALVAAPPEPSWPNGEAAVEQLADAMLLTLPHLALSSHSPDALSRAILAALSKSEPGETL